MIKYNFRNFTKIYCMMMVLLILDGVILPGVISTSQLPLMVMLLAANSIIVVSIVLVKYLYDKLERK